MPPHIRKNNTRHSRQELFITARNRVFQQSFSDLELSFIFEAAERPGWSKPGVSCHREIWLEIPAT
jgi:hypothetical protein